MNQTKYKKSDTCVFCGEKVFNKKRDGNFLCLDCEKMIEKEIYNLLKEKSVYKDDIKEVSLFSSSGWGSTHKNTTIKIGYNYGRNIYVILPTAKILEIRDLKNEQLLLDYLELEIKVQYALKSVQIDEEHITDRALEIFKKYRNRLEQILNLPDNWDGDNAKAFSSELIKKVGNILLKLKTQPEIFPTARNTIQLEYEKDDGSYLEFEIAEDENAKVFMIDSEGNEKQSSVKANPEEINNIVSSFYG